MKRLTRRIEVLPVWLGAPLALLGVWYIFVGPFGFDWVGYAVGLAMAIFVGWWTRSRYEVKVLERSERGVVYWMRRLERGKPVESSDDQQRRIEDASEAAKRGSLSGQMKRGD